MSLDSFKTRTRLASGSDDASPSTACRHSSAPVSASRDAAVFAEDPAREPAAPRRQRLRQGGRHPRAGVVGSGQAGAERNLLHAGARPAAGLHRRAVRRRPGRHARRDRRRWAADPSRSIRSSRWSSSSITRCRSITSGRASALQLNAELEYQRNRERYVFLRWGQTAVRNFRVVPPETGIVHQVNIEYLARVVSRDSSDAARRRLSRHAVRHRLAHDDGQRPGRRRLGRGRHRGRGGDARAAELDADSAGGRLPADRPAARAARPRPISC